MDSVIDKELKENSELFDSIDKFREDQDFQRRLQVAKEEFDQRIANVTNQYISETKEQLSIMREYADLGFEHEFESIKKFAKKANKIKTPRIKTTFNVWEKICSISRWGKLMSEDISDKYFYGGSVIKNMLYVAYNLGITLPIGIVLVMYKIIRKFI